MFLFLTCYELRILSVPRFPYLKEEMAILILLL